MQKGSPRRSKLIYHRPTTDTASGTENASAEVIREVNVNEVKNRYTTHSLTVNIFSLNQQLWFQKTALCLNQWCTFGTEITCFIST